MNFLIKLGDLNYVHKNYKDAIEYWNKTKKLNGFSRLYLLGICYYKEKNYNKAKKIFIKIDNNDSLFILAKIYLKTFKYAKALDFLYKLSKVTEYYFLKVVNFIHGYYELSFFKSEIVPELFEKAFMINNPLHSLPYKVISTLASKSYDNKDYHKAIYYYKILIEEYKEKYHVTYLIKSYIHLDDLDNILKYYELGISCGYDMFVNYLLGLYYKKKENYDKMEELFLKICPHYYKALSHLCKYYIDNNRFDKIEALLIKIIEETNDNWIISDLCNFYKSRREIYKIKETMIKYNCYDKLGKYYFKKNKIDKMLYYYDLIKQEDDDGEYEYRMGIYYNKINDLENAKKYLLDAKEKGNLEYYKKLYKVYKKEKDYDKMFDMLKGFIGDNKLMVEINKLIMDNEYNAMPKIFEEIEKIDINEYETKEIPMSILMIKKIMDKKIDMIKMPFKYEPGYKGFRKAKNDFMNKIKKGP